MHHCAMAGILLAGILVGCSQPPAPARPAGDVDRWMIHTVNDVAVRNAIIRQHTLYPYHFIENAAELNDLGQRDLAVLVEHLAEHAGPLNVRQGDISQELYRRRLAYVAAQLTGAGVPRDRVEIRDAPAGGEGLSSRQIVVGGRPAAAPVEGGTP